MQIGLTRVPSLDVLTEENLLAVKGLLDLLAAGVRVVHVAQPAANGWQLAAGDSDTGLAVATLDDTLSLSPQLNHQAVIYQTAPAQVEAARAMLRAIIEAGAPITEGTLQAFAGDSFHVREIEDGEAGVTYRTLFGEYLAGASRIRIIDPYVRQGYQVDSLADFLAQAPLSRPCTVELITMYAQNPRFGTWGREETRERLDRLQQRLASDGIQFSYEFDPTIHDRLILTDRWQIILGRGLDIFYAQENGERPARQCRIVYLCR